MKSQDLFSGENKKKHLKILPAELFLHNVFLTVQKQSTLVQ